MAAIGGENRDVGIDADCVIAPVPSSDHPSVEIEDARKLGAVEAGNRAPVPGSRERRDNAQALLTFGRGWLALFMAATSWRSWATSSSSSASRTRAGSTSSPHGVP